MNLSLYISPCPNDTFAFNHLLHSNIVNNITFTTKLHDIQELNNIALQNTADVIKISFALLPLVQEHYELLHSGAALGNNVGPLFITNHTNIDVAKANLQIAIPGKYTTANFLLQYAYPHLTQKHEVLFSDIENALLQNKYDAGVIIHENRFTYAQKGLHKIVDLGEHWHQQTNLPIPLGGIVVKKTLPAQVKQQLHTALQQSIQMAWQQYPTLPNFVQQHAQEMDEEVMRKHIELYVNNETLQLSAQGLQAIELLKNTLAINS
jgi:1,4-dihydroxy-6-naphthoate synthase